MFRKLKTFDCFGKKISAFEKNNRIIKEVLFYYCSLRDFWTSSREGIYGSSMYYLWKQKEKNTFV